MIRRPPFAQTRRVSPGRVGSDGKLMAYRHAGLFFASDTDRKYVALNDLWSAGERPSVVDVLDMLDVESAAAKARVVLPAPEEGP